MKPETKTGTEKKIIKHMQAEDYRFEKVAGSWRNKERKCIIL